MFIMLLIFDVCVIKVMKSKSRKKSPFVIYDEKVFE